MKSQNSPEITDALTATRAFVGVLRAEELFSWAERFEIIVTNLETGKTAEAIHSYSNTKYTGPGSLSDIFAKDEKAFYSAWGACSKALRSLQRLTHQSSGTGENFLR